MDVKHENENICHGVQCDICREKTVKLFRNMKHFLKRFVNTHDLICTFLFSFVHVAVVEIKQTKLPFWFVAEMKARGVSRVLRFVITIWISIRNKTTSKSFCKKSKGNTAALMLFQKVLSSCAETSSLSEWLRMCKHNRRRWWLRHRSFNMKKRYDVITRTLTITYNYCIFANCLQ